MIRKLKHYFSDMTTEKKQQMVKWGAGVFLLVAVLAFYYSQNSNQAPARARQENQAQFALPRPDMAKESWLEKGQRDLESVKRQNRELEARLKMLEGKVASGALETGAPGTAAEREARLKADFARIGVTPVEKGGSDLYPPSPVPAAVAAKPEPVKPTKPEEVGLPPGVSAKPPVQAPAPSSPAPLSLGSPAVNRVLGVYDFTQNPIKPLGESKDEKVATEELSQFDNFYTPSGSFFKVSFLTGLDAPSGVKSQGKPHPVLLRIQDLSWLPNSIRQDISGCHILAEAHGDLSAERAYVRGVNLSCVNHENQEVLDTTIFGFIADTDGKLGMRGRVVSKQGEYLARGLMAGFVEGVAKGFDNSVNTTYVGSGGVGTVSEIDGFTDGFKKGMSSGFGRAARELSQFYIESAENIYPIIEVNALRNGTFILTEGKRFSFDRKITLEKERRISNDVSL